MKLKKANTENGITEYEIKSSGFNNITSANLMTLINKLKACDYDLKELAGGRLKLMPFSVKTSKAKTVAAKSVETEAASVQKQETLDYLLSRF